MKNYSDRDILPVTPNPVKMPNSISYFLTLILIILLASCLEPIKNHPEIVKLYGNSSVCNFSKDYILFFTRCHPGQPGALVASDGDILSTSNWMLQLDPSFKDMEGNLHFIDSDSILQIQGKTVAIALDSFSHIEQLIDIKNNSALMQLKMIGLSQTGFEQNVDGIKKIGEVNKNCNLLLKDQFEDRALQDLLEILDPKMMYVDLPESQQNLLATEKQLEILIMYNNDSIYHCSTLPAFPNLHTLFFQFDGNDIENSENNKEWLKNNPQIKTLIINDWNEKYPKGLLSHLSSPETLILGGMEIPDSEIMAHKSTLKRLITDNSKLQMQLPHVDWLTILEKENADYLLQNIANEKQDCKILEIVNIDTPININPLQQLKKLEVLTIVDSDSMNLEVVKQMKQLKWLSFGSKELQTDSTVQVLQTALPNTMVVSNEGFCMGSGWFILLLPLSVLALWLANIRLSYGKNGGI